MATTAIERKLLIDGEWVETGEWVEVASPYDGSLVGRVAKAGAAETRQALDAADTAMREPIPAHERAAILDRDGEKAQALADELGDATVAFEADVTDEGQVQNAVAGAVEAFGELRLVVGCAGIGWAEKTAGKQGATA